MAKTPNLEKGQHKNPLSATCFTNGTIDNLTFTYNYGTNRLQKVADATVEALARAQGLNSSTYSTGNLTSDPHKGASSGMTVT